MFESSYLVIFIISEVVIGLAQSASVISLSGNVDNEYELFNKDTKEQMLAPVNIYLHNYVHKETHESIKLVTLQVVSNENNFYLDSFLMSDVEPPFVEANHIINIGGVVFVSIVPDTEMWVIFLATDGCVQRIYTDRSWKPTNRLERALTPPQCKQFLEKMKPRPPPWRPGVTASPSTSLPTLGTNQGKIIEFGDSNIDRPSSTEDIEVTGVTTKVIVSRGIHRVTWRCTTLVYINKLGSTDILDIIQTTCDDKASLMMYPTKRITVYGGLIYLRDTLGEPVWAVYVLKDHCELKIYTDKAHEVIITKKRHLTWKDCKRVVDTQQINWLQKLPPVSVMKGSPKKEKENNVNNLEKLKMVITRQNAVLSPNKVSNSNQNVVPSQASSNVLPSQDLKPQPLGPQKENTQTPTSQPLSPKPLGLQPLTPQQLGPQKTPPQLVQPPKGNPKQLPKPVHKQPFIPPNVDPKTPPTQPLGLQPLGLQPLGLQKDRPQTPPSKAPETQKLPLQPIGTDKKPQSTTSDKVTSNANPSVSTQSPSPPQKGNSPTTSSQIAPQSGSQSPTPPINGQQPEAPPEIKTDSPGLIGGLFGKVRGIFGGKSETPSPAIPLDTNEPVSQPAKKRWIFW